MTETILEHLIAKASQFSFHQRWKGERKLCSFRLPMDLIDATKSSAKASGAAVNTFVIQAIEKAVKS